MSERIHERASKPLRRVTRAAGDLRDLDVQIGLLAERRARAEDDLAQAGIEHLLVLAEDRRKVVEDRMTRWLDAFDFDSLESRLRAAVRDVTAHLPQESVATNLLALSLLTPFVERLQRELPPDHDVPDAEPFHRFRIAVKKLRFALELFEPVLGPRYEALHREAEHLQELLGAHHDFSVLSDLAWTHHATLLAAGYTALAGGLASVATAADREQALSLRAFREATFDPAAFRSELEAALMGPNGP
jgi:CHAD domain-containing protein